jgi:putative resolvase
LKNHKSMQNDTFITSKEARELLKVSNQTLRSYAEADKIRAIRTPSNQRRYSQSDIYNILGCNQAPPKKRQVLYARVSSKKQMDDLERQVHLLQSTFADYELVTDCGSGINWKRKGLRTILEWAMQGELQTLVVAHRDRLCRFAFGLLEFILKTSNVKLVVLDDEVGSSSEQELADDILSIIQVYACRKMGKRRYTRKKTEIVSHKESDENIEAVDGNNESSL